MKENYVAKYENPEGLIKASGWTQGEVNRYLSFLENADPELLREIHKKTGVHMFKDTETVDPEAAIFVLTTPTDVKKEDLFKVLDMYLN